MSDNVMRALGEIVDVLCKHLGPQVLNQDVASDIDIDRHDDFRSDMQEVAADILALPTLRAALTPPADEEVERIRERHEELERLGELAHHDWASEAHTDRATLLRRDAQREAELGRLREALGTLTDCQPVPKVYKYTGTAEVDVENMFDVGHRHKNGKQPRDYLMSWLSMFRPFAYATKDDSWGELEKLISIVMNNYVQILVRAEAARATQKGTSDV